MTIGKNLTFAVDAKTGIVTITFDAKKRLGPSASGKTIMVATTSGNLTLPNGVILGLNAYVKS